jgi:hypothetical protein
MKNFKSCWLLAMTVCATLFTSCEGEDSASVDQSRIYTTYELFYDKNEDKTYARAQFKFGNLGGTLLELTDPAEVRFNNDLLEFKPGFVWYEKAYAGRVTSGSFTYQGTDGVSYTNTVANQPTIDFPANFTSVTRNQANTFNWAGTPLTAGEDVTLFIGNTTTINTQTFYTNKPGATNLVLGAAQLNNLAPNVPAEADLFRSRIDSLSQKTAVGGFVKLSYRAQKKAITVQ